MSTIWFARPEVQRPDELKSFDEFTDDDDQSYPFWRSMQGKALQSCDEVGDPISRAWLRFTDTDTDTETEVAPVAGEGTVCATSTV